MEIFSIILLFTVAFVGFYIAKALMKVNKIAKKITTSSTPWPEQVKAEKLHKFQFKLLGYQLFEHKLVTFIDDLKLSTEEIQELDKLINFFNLNPYRIGAIKAKYNKSAIEKLSKIALSDNVITDKERSAMFQLAESLNLPAATVDKINRTNALKILMSAREDALSDSRLTEKEENQLLELTDKLGLSEDDLLGSMPEQRRMSYCKLMWDVENGNLPEIASPVILQKNEICHFAIDAERLETKMVTTGYSGGSRGVSVRIAKGVSYRVGAYRAQPIKEEVTYRYPGTLVITSKRIIFVASEKGFSMPINKLDNIEQYRDGLGFQKGATNYLLTIEYPDLAGLIISEAVSRL